MNLKLLDDVKEIIQNNEQEVNKTGKGFNLISILGMEHNERYTHSNIITELLKADGSHTFGNRFFELFLAEVGISDFSTKNYEVLTEEYVGQINCGENESIRTFLDIVIKDKNTGKVILIENKIWAEDQPYQIERYYEKYNSRIVKLFYLNVHDYDYSFDLERVERVLSDNEREELQRIKAVYQKISYEKNIKNWIANCIVVSSEKLFVRIQIETYYQTILKISNQDIYKKMNEQIKSKITESEESFEAAREIAHTFTALSNSIGLEFYRKLKEMLPNGEFDSIYGKIEFFVQEDKDEDPLYLGVKLKDQDNRLIKNNEEFNLKIANIVAEFPQNETGERYTENGTWNVWFYLSRENSFYNTFINSMTEKQKFKLIKDLDNEVHIAYNEFNVILEKLKSIMK